MTKPGARGVRRRPGSCPSDLISVLRAPLYRDRITHAEHGLAMRARCDALNAHRAVLRESPVSAADC